MSIPEARTATVLPAAGRHRQSGVTLIELVMFIIIVGIGVAGVLMAYTAAVSRSADPVVRKQMLSVAEAMLEEVELMPFTYCDPADANAATAGAALVGGANCATTVEAIGPEAGQTRYSLTTPFNNVNDYAGFDSNTASPSGINDLMGNAIPGLAGYRVQVAVSAQALGPAGSLIAATDGNGAAQSLLVTVTVTDPRGDFLTLSGLRTRYAPNALP